MTPDMAEAPAVAQHYLECSSCGYRPAKHYCETCDGDLCDQCHNEHLNRKISGNHLIIPIKDSRKHGICTVHYRRNDFYCNQCETPICLNCSKTDHSNHAMESIKKAFATRKETFSNNLRQVENVLIPKYEYALKNLEDNLREAEKRGDEKNSVMEEKTEKLILTIQHCLEKWKISVRQNKESNQLTYSKYKENINSDTEKLKEISKDLRERMRSNESESNSKFWDRVQSLCNFQPPDVVSFSPVVPKAELFPQKIVGHFESYMEGGSNKPKADLMASFDSNLSAVYYIDIANPSEIWVSGNKVDMSLFNINGEKLNEGKAETKDEDWPSGLGVMNDKSVIYSDYQNKCIRKMSTDNMHTVFIQTDWHPIGLYVTSNENILVSTRFLSEMKSKEQKGRVCRYGQDTTLNLTVDSEDQDGDLLFRGPDDICENINRDICVTDTVHKQVTVVSMIGQLRFKHKGHNNRLFVPQGICTDNTGNILIANAGDSSVHMLNMNGEFIGYLLTREDGIEDPNPLRLDGESRLWLAERYTGQIKVFKYCI